MSKKRFIGLDIIRTIAVLSVISVHYLIPAGFYSSNINNNSTLVLLIMRWLFNPCVAYFLILTGYLQVNHNLNKKHYKSIFTIILSYLIVSFITILINRVYYKSNINVISIIFDIIEFKYIPYAWYINMYIGLYLLIPFLNKLYKNLTKNEKKILIGTLVFICSIPSVLNDVSINNINMNIFPDWWIKLYPFMFYFVGCYIHEYKPKINKKINILFIIFILLFETTLSYLYFDFGSYNYQIFEGNGSFLNLILSTSIFILLYNIDLKNKVIVKMFSSISINSFNIFLLSYIIGNIIYAKFGFLISNTRMAIVYYPILSLSIFIICYILSLAIEYILVKIKRTFKYIILLKKRDVYD